MYFDAIIVIVILSMFAYGINLRCEWRMRQLRDRFKRGEMAYHEREAAKANRELPPDARAHPDGNGE